MCLIKFKITINFFIIKMLLLKRNTKKANDI